jgi:hypothetical protein
VAADGTTWKRFPLVARPRPACTALRGLAGEAADPADLTAATCVHNQAALIASDCGQPGVTAAWCRRHATAWLNRAPLDGRTAKYAFEPLVNLARLSIRDGEGDIARAALADLLTAVTSGGSVTVAGLHVPATAVPTDPPGKKDLVTWLWGVILADGTRALTGDGRWGAAARNLQRHEGILSRMLDGRQVAVIAASVAGDPDTARQLIHGTAPGQPWESTVTACLAAMVDPPRNPTAVSVRPHSTPSTGRSSGIRHRLS